jgi:uncharacterized RDD family membrane protein YckC
MTFAQTSEQYIQLVLDVMPRSMPTRAEIAIELRGHIAERLGGGQKLEEVLRQLGDPVALAESYLAAVPLVSATFWRRAAAKIVDVCLVAIVMTPPVWFLLRSETLFPFALLLALAGGSLLFWLYTTVSEWAFGATLGKHLLALRVVRESGARISLGQAIVRQLPLLLQVYWIDVLFALFTEKSQRAFELLSKTRVAIANGHTAPMKAATPPASVA